MTEENRTRIRFLMEEHKWAWNRFPQVTELYLHLLDAALREDEPYGEIMLRRGDVICSLKTLSEASGQSVAVIRRALKKLNGTMDAESVMYGNTRIIHIRDYDLYMGRKGNQKTPRDAGAGERECRENGDAEASGEAEWECRENEDAEASGTAETEYQVNEEEEAPCDEIRDAEPAYAYAAAEDPNADMAEDSGRKRGSDTKEAGGRQGENRLGAMLYHEESNAQAAPRICGRKAPAVRRIHPGAMGGYRGAYYSGATRVCENTESLVTLCNPEKEIESKTIYHTHSYHTHSPEQGRAAVHGYTVPVVIHTGDSGDSGTAPGYGAAGSYGPSWVSGASAAGKGRQPSGMPVGSSMPSGAGKGASELFERFWKVYPRHVNRYMAQCAFERLNPDAETLEGMLKALERQKESQAWHVEEGRYIPYPARWLSEHRWEDDPAESERKFRTGQESAPKYTVPAQNYEQRDYSEEMETPEEMLARLRRGVGRRE